MSCFGGVLSWRVLQQSGQSALIYSVSLAFLPLHLPNALSAMPLWQPSLPGPKAALKWVTLTGVVVGCQRPIEEEEKKLQWCFFCMALLNSLLFYLCRWFPTWVSGTCRGPCMFFKGSSPQLSVLRWGFLTSWNNHKGNVGYKTRITFWYRLYLLCSELY